MKLPPQQLLPILLGSAIAAAGWMQGLQWKSLAREGDPNESVEVVALQQQIDQLTKENEALRSLSQGGGEFAVPPELVTRVEKQVGLSFRSTPIVHKIANEELRDRVAASIEARFGPGGIDDREKAYKLVGWLGPEDRLLGQLSALRAVGARAWFDEVSGEGWVTDRFQLENVPDQASLLRVLTRILLEQHYPMAKGDLKDEPMRARDALHTGVAAGVEAKFYQDNARAIGFMSLKQDNEASQLLLSMPPFLQGLMSFLSQEGKTFADQAILKGQDQLHKALHQPPTKTAELMYLFERNLPNKTITLPVTPGEMVLEDSGGALGLRLWLDPLGDVQASRDIAEQLVDDQWRLYATDDRTHHLIWIIELADEKTTDTALAAFCGMGSYFTGSENDLTAGKPAQTPEGRWITIDRPSPTSIRLQNTADAATAEKILSGQP